MFPGRRFDVSRDTMTDNTDRKSLNRRRLLVGGSMLAASTPIAIAMAMQEVSPQASPGASPVASPQSTPVLPTPTPLPPTPTPQPVPNHAINVVRDRAEYGEPQTGGELRMFIQSDGLYDANPATQSQDMTLLMSVFEGLVRINPVTMAAEPGLAESWAWSEDGLQLTFNLRPDVRWHDDSPFTANDAGLTCMMYRDDYDSSLAGLFGLIDQAQAVDDTTLVLTFAAPDGAFLFNGASMPMLQAAQYQPLWDEFVPGEKTITRPGQSISTWIGTGPWKIDNVDSERISLVRFADYWDEPALADALLLMVEDDESERLKGWQDGAVDVLSITARQMPEVWGEEGNLFVAPSSVAMFAAFNFHNPANATSTMMVDQSLRTALTMATNRDRYADDVFYGFINEHAVGTMAQQWLHDEELKNPPYDIEEAKNILAEGGWSDIDGDGMLEDQYGNKTDLYLIVRDDERPELLALLTGLQDDWARIGVRLTVQPLFTEVFDTRWVQSRDYDLVAYTLVNYPAFNEFDLYGSQWDIRNNVRGWNPGGYYNSGVDAAIQDWFKATEPDAMASAAAEIQHLTNEDLFGIWFGFPEDLVLVRKDIQGFNADAFLYSQSAHRWWRGDGEPIVATPIASPQATPQATPGATPVTSPEATPAD